MLEVINPPYDKISVGDITSIYDHLNGFDSSLRSKVLDEVSARIKSPHKILVEYIFDESVKRNYPLLELTYNPDMWSLGNHVNDFQNYKIHPALNFKNFVCSFNGDSHVSRKLLVSILKKFEFFNENYSSKNFVYSTNDLDGHIFDYVGNQVDFYRKFFISNTSESFFQTAYTFGHVRFDHKKNIYNLEKQLTESFLHIVSETMATSYYPFVTEKFLYSIVTRGLFLSYAQPGWHRYVEKNYGFKLYNKIFDYSFDLIQNPIERLVELMSMISKFSYLNASEWNELYQLEADTVEYNYNHYFSGNYLKAAIK